MSGRPPDAPVPADSAGDPAPAPRLRLVTPPADPPAAPPSDALLAELDALLARPAREPGDLERLAALARSVPGRQRAVVAALAAAGTPAAVAALLDLAPVPGALEAVARALARGLTRAWPPTSEPARPHAFATSGAPEPALPDPETVAFATSGAPEPALHAPLASAPIDPAGPDASAATDAGHLAPVFLALEFRSSRARPFPDLLRRAQLLAAASGPDPAAAPALRLDVLRVGQRPAYRLSFWPERLPPRRRAALARALATDLARLHARLARLRGTRLWLNGFCFPEDGPVSPAAQAHLLGAWLTWTTREGA